MGVGPPPAHRWAGGGGYSPTFVYIIVNTLASTYICLSAHRYLFPLCMLSLCLRAARVFGKDCLRQLLATVENITNVKSYLVLFTNWSYTPA